MAVIKYSALLEQLRGNLNGTVLSKYRSGFNSYKKGQPKRWGSAAQQKNRQLFTIASQQWKNVTPQFRNNIAAQAAECPQPDRFGNLRILSPWNYYMLLSRLRQTVGYSISTLPNQTIRTLNTYEPVDASITITQSPSGVYLASGQIRIRRLSSGQIGTSVLYYISSAVPKTDQNRRRTHYFLSHALMTTSGSNPNVQTHTFSDLPLPASFSPYNGNQVEVKVITMHRDIGTIGIPIYFRANMQYIPPAPPVWDINLTWGSSDSRYVNLIAPSGNWQAGDGGQIAVRLNEALPAPASNYNFELAFSPNISGTDTPAPTDFAIPQPTFSGVMQNLGSAPTYGARITSGLPVQSFLNTNFTYNSSNPYQYQPIAFRIQRPTDGAWSDWTYSTIWLPAF